ncbi:hypothetical protein EDB95_2383 [Dinghuibacter silviterrae]|uniref:Dialkylrecorsinol condensing enzyme n=2 Tax=Dinghuibacter silviterrae TaxID=1539049 RepID=A0A4R8DTB2_9BACT|nr:hypothetical protein EDB95_2383 [Dinghuibacter silviterrae]
MPKRVLAIYYSQTGQLGDIMARCTAPLSAAGVTVDTVVLRARPDYPFPWTSQQFFSLMPDCVLSVPGSLEPFSLGAERYDLIVFGYQPWFLSPSIPVNTLLHSPAFQSVLNGTPVVTVTGCRNMWIGAFIRLRSALEEKGARLVGNIALVDRHPNLVSLLTIMHWLFGGAKTRYLNFFPLPGVSETDIARMEDYGRLIVPALQEDRWEALQPALVAAGAVEIKPHLFFIERNGARIFGIWANLIVRRKNRKPWLVAFKWYIMVALFLLGPLVYVITQLIIRPLFHKKVSATQNHYLYLN